MVGRFSDPQLIVRHAHEDWHTKDEELRTQKIKPGDHHYRPNGTNYSTGPSCGGWGRRRMSFAPWQPRSN